MNLELNLKLLLRYLLSGAYVTIVFTLSFNQDYDLIELPAIKELNLATLAGIAALAGSLNYSLYRALILPWLIRLIRFSMSMPRDVVSAQVKMWTRRNNEKSLQVNLFDWADQSHFLACSGISGVIALLVGDAQDFEKSKWYSDFGLLSCVMIIAAILSLCQLQARQKIVDDLEP